MSGTTELVLAYTRFRFRFSLMSVLPKTLVDVLIHQSMIVDFSFPIPRKKKKQDGEMIKLKSRFCEKHCLTRQISIIVALQIRK